MTGVAVIQRDRVPRAESEDSPRHRVIVNRMLIVIASALILLGVSMGQTFVTWINATLL